MPEFEKILSGGDLRSIGNNGSVIRKIHGQKEFDILFKCLFHENRIVVMRAADAIEKITCNDPNYLYCHKDEVIDLCNRAIDKELKWHLALLLPRLQLTNQELRLVWDILKKWGLDKTNSRIVRVNSIQGLFEVTKLNTYFNKEFNLIIVKLESENIPSINARIKKLRKLHI